MKTRYSAIVTAVMAVGVALGANAGSPAKCGSLTMAEMNWPSAELMANVDKIILEAGYGCDVELIPGATMTTFASMNEKSKPDVAGELWVNSIVEPLKAAKAEGRLFSVNDGPITDIGAGWWIPPHTAAKHPELKTVLDILERPDLFPHPEDPSKGALVGCPAGWGCQMVNANLFRAFDMENKGWLLVDPGSAAGLDGSMAKAVERGENWLGYYWSPTSITHKYGMVKLDFGIPFAGKENWDTCIVKPEHDCANPKPSAWTQSAVNTIVTKKFNEKSSPVKGYLANRVFPGKIMNGMLAYMSENQAGGEDAAFEFLEKYQDVWTKWVSSEVAVKVKSAL